MTDALIISIVGFFSAVTGSVVTYVISKDKTAIDKESKEKELTEMLLDSAREYLSEYRKEIELLKIEYKSEIGQLKLEVNRLSTVAEESENRLEDLIQLCTSKLKEAGFDTETIVAAGIRRSILESRDK